MHFKQKFLWFVTFTALFAVAAWTIFMGTWSFDRVPVMPDCPLPDASRGIDAWIDGWFINGKFIPDDIKVFLGPAHFWAELQYVLAAYFAALGLVYYCRGRGLSRLAAYGAGLLLAFSGYWFSLFSAGHLGWFRWMTYGVFAFGLADRAIRKGKIKNWLLLGACVAWASFYQSDLWLIFTVFTAAYFVWCCVREHKLPWKGALLAAATFFIIGAPSFKSAICGDLKDRDEAIKSGATISSSIKDEEMRRWLFVTNWSLPPEESAEFFIPRLNGDTSCPYVLALGKKNRSGVVPYTGALGRQYQATRGNYRQHSLYVGLVTCVLALSALVLGWRRREIVFFTVAAVVFWLFSAGRYFEFIYRFVYALPFGDYLRAPVKWHHLTEFCICVLAAYGIGFVDVQLRKLGPCWKYAMPVAILLGAADLVRINRLYCAPQELSQNYTFISRQQTNDPRFEDSLKSIGGKIVGSVGGGYDMVCIAVPKQPAAPYKRATSRPLPVLGIISLMGTFAVSVIAATASLRRRK